MRRAILAAICSLVILGGCDKPAPSEGGVSFESPKAGPRAHVGSAILDFKAPKLGGGQVVGNEFANKDVAIWFWAPW